MNEFDECVCILNSGLFDEEYYLSRNPDVERSRMDPITHYVRYGEAEMRQPSAALDIATLRSVYGSKHILYQYINMPSRTRPTIDIAYAFDNYYLPVACVSILSLLDHLNQAYNYNIHLFYEDYLAKRVIFIEELARDGMSFISHPLDKDKMSIIKKGHPSAHLTTGAFIRLLIPNLIESSARILYVDCDTIIKDDISELFNIDLKGCAIGGIPEIFLDTPYFQNLISSIDFCSLDKYVNSGILIFDLQKCRQMSIYEKFVKILNSGRKFKCHDQDIINIACSGSICTLDRIWNFPWHYHIMELYKHFTPEQFKNYANAFVKHKILHYTSHFKPWNTRCEYFDSIFWKYASDTPFYDELSGRLSNAPKMY